VHAEVANAILTLHRAGYISLADAREVVAVAVGIPVRTSALDTLIEPAWEVARERHVSVYDACYIMLAETLDAPLVTADRRLAGATRNSVLITG
jgi:predicted nucleic acid-binding protein